MLGGGGGGGGVTGNIFSSGLALSPFTLRVSAPLESIISATRILMKKI